MLVLFSCLLNICPNQQHTPIHSQKLNTTKKKGHRKHNLNIMTVGTTGLTLQLIKE